MNWDLPYKYLLWRRKTHFQLPKKSLTFQSNIVMLICIYITLPGWFVSIVCNYSLSMTKHVQSNLRQSASNYCMTPRCRKEETQALLAEGCCRLSHDRANGIKLNIKKTASELGAPYTSLRNRFLNIHKPHHKAHIEQQFLSPAKEDILVTWLLHLGSTTASTSHNTLPEPRIPLSMNILNTLPYNYSSSSYNFVSGF